MRCAIMTCGGDAVELVEHPGRPESETPLCELHATRVRRQVGTEVIRRVV